MMKYIILGGFLLLGILLFLVYFFRKRWAIKKVKMSSDIEKLCSINAILDPFGFEFLLDQDIVVSKKDAWQKDFGYQDLYDLKAPFFNMVMDSLPITFSYQGRVYRFEFWKGQYGITTGAEIGLYVKDDFHKNNFHAVCPEEELKLNYVLYRNCKLFTRSLCTWWLTGFMVGLFSRPCDLRMDICIEFLEEDMKEAFIEALIQAGITRDQIMICHKIVCFSYCKPTNYYPNYKYKIIKLIAQTFSFINCCLYRKITRMFNRTLDQLTYLRFMAPWLYRFIICLSIPRRKIKKYKK